MKRIMAILLLTLMCLGAAYSADEGRFMKYPDIFGDKIVFNYEGDLWLVNADGGIAMRMTNAPGNEYAAKFSPDGKTIAFTASYDGPAAVYSIPATGGAPIRLTFNFGGAQTICWTPDGERIVFRSMMRNVIGRDANLFFVGKNGSVPEQLPIDRGVLCSFSSDGQKMLYCRRGTEEYYWKRYKGGRYQDIWMYDFGKNQFNPVSDYVGKNSYPMWIGDAMLFISDRTNGIANLYRQNLLTKEITQLTTYSDVDVMMPSTDGKRLVFLHDGFLHVMDIPSGTIKRITVTIPSDRWSLRTRVVNPKDYIHYTDIANDGKSLLLEARGDLFTLPVEKGLPVNLSYSPGTREQYPQWSPDGKTIAFFSDRSGEYQLYLQKAEGGEWTQLTTSLDRTNYHLLWSPDGKKILFGNKDFTLFYIDITTKKLTKIDSSNQMKNDEFFWEVSDYSWSPDSKWIVYSFVQFNRNSQIFLYHLETAKRYAVTDDFYDNLNPTFDANMRYLYFLSSRNFGLNMDFYEDNHVVASPYHIMVVQLKDGEAPPFAEITSGEKKAIADKLQIDIEGLQQRTFPAPIPSGNYFYLKAGKGKILWCATSSFTEDEYGEIFKPSSDTKWDLHIFDVDKKKEITVSEKIRNFNISANGEQLVIRRNEDLYATSMEKLFDSKNIGEKISLTGMQYTVDVQAEWNQIFNDTWRWYRDFFYDPEMHGRDWKAMGDRYRAYLPYLSSRDELNWVLQQMVGELCVSHTYIGGGDSGPSSSSSAQIFTGWLGADLIPEKKAGYYRFETIYGPNDINRNLVAPLSRPDVVVKEGDYLIAVNGKEIKYPEDYDRRLQIMAGQRVSITVNSKPTNQGAKTFEVEPIKYDGSFRYFRWLNNNISKVLSATDGKVGYMHINAMGSGGIGEFDKFWRAFRYKDGIIIDVRRNGGGWTEYFLIDKLERQMVAYNVLKNMAPFRYPGSAGNGQYVLISNENNGSDGEAFVEHFKARKLGTVVGVPSWGGLVGILNTQLTIDNGTVEQSNNAFFGRDGKWIVENHGADPDVVIDNDPASVMAGKDLQLDKAIEVIKENIRKNPFTFPARPPYPKK